jgi:hypothetical protein
LQSGIFFPAHSRPTVAQHICPTLNWCLQIGKSKYIMLRCIKKSSQPKLHQYLKTVSQKLDYSYINQDHSVAHRKCLSKLVFPNWHWYVVYFAVWNFFPAHSRPTVAQHICPTLNWCFQIGKSKYMMLRCIEKRSQPKLHQYLKTVSQWLDFSYINQHNLAAHRKCLSKLLYPNWHWYLV